MVDDGMPAANSLATLRTQLGLDRPFGSKAVALGVGTPLPVGLPPSVASDDPVEPPEAPIVPPELPGELLDAAVEQPDKDAAHVEIDDDLPF